MYPSYRSIEKIKVRKERSARRDDLTELEMRWEIVRSSLLHWVEFERGRNAASMSLINGQRESEREESESLWQVRALATMSAPI